MAQIEDVCPADPEISWMIHFCSCGDFHESL